MRFSKDNTWAVKGLAICMMMFHHLFFQKSRFAGFDVNFAPFSQPQVVNIAILCKVCVSLFAFLTGYGLFISYNNMIKKQSMEGIQTDKWCIYRLVKTMSGFWYIYIVCFIVTMLLDRLPVATYYDGNGPVKGIMYCLLDFFGVGYLVGTPTLCETWWYMGAAIVFILLVPLLYNIAEYTGWFGILIISIILPRMINMGFPGIVSIVSFIPAFVLGMMFAKYKLFDHIEIKLSDLGRVKSNILCWGLALIGIAGSYLMYARFTADKIWGIEYGFIPLIFIMFVKYCLCNIKWLNQFLIFMGKRSMTIFLTHTFLRYRYLKEWVYSRGHFLTIFIALFAASLILAIILDLMKKLIGVDKIADRLCGKLTYDK
ncbi:MAG: acyltransferase [Lachnospiraceae bacterium]|nr:acyltransferase [Lachnospiraceae bacterium]